MRNPFKSGDKKEYKKVVTANDFARFNGEVVHPVLSTFSLARDMEWTTRQFVLQMCEEDEEGIGTFLSIEHKSPAFENEEVVFSGYIDAVNDHEIICSVKAECNGRLIATGKTGQKILKRKSLEKLFRKP